MGSHKKLAN